MPWLNTEKRYGSLAIAFHWLMLVIIVAVCLTMELRSFFPRGGPERALMATLHYGLGLSIFVLVWLRLLVRGLGVRPVIAPRPPQWQRLLAACVQWALYGLMAILPVLGWFAVSAKGQPIVILGLPLPLLVSPDKARFHTLKDLHETLANAGYYVVGLHAVAALFHHYFRRDNALKLMLPFGAAGRDR